MKTRVVSVGQERKKYNSLEWETEIIMELGITQFSLGTVIIIFLLTE